MSGLAGLVSFMLLAVVVRYVIRGLLAEAVRRRDAPAARGKPDMSAAWSPSERIRNTALLQEELDRQGDGEIRVSCIVLESARTVVVPPRFLMVTADLAEDDISADQMAEIARSIVAICVEKSLVESVGGLELMLRNALDGGSHRIARLSMLKSSLHLAAGIQGTHLAQAEPFPGIRCRVYTATNRHGAAGWN